jgi:hypothetical protein
MFIAIADSVNGGSGQGTGSGGGGNRTAPVLQFLGRPQDRFPKSYKLAFTSESEFPFSVFIGETEYVINSTADTVSGQITQVGVPVEASLSFGARVHLAFGKGETSSVNKIFRFDNFIVGQLSFSSFHTEDPDFSGVTTLPARILDDLNSCFAFATVLPSNIGLWDVSNVLIFNGMFNGVSESAMSDAFGQWTFGDSARIGGGTFENISDADLASCLVQWEANANQGSSLDLSGEPFGVDPRGGGAPRDLDETIYPDAKAAYDNLIANNSWNFGTSINWFVPIPPLLDDYPNAAAAYSVRLLRTAYSGSALRVRRNAAPFDEQDIGFTAGGDLDEAAIVAFGGSDELRVSAWYDQSGQSNHATQIAPGSQPQIYNGTAVITENGKAAIQWDGINDHLITGEITYSSSYGQDFVVGSVFGSSDDGILNMWGVDGGPNLMMNVRTVRTFAVRMNRGGTLLTSSNNVFTSDTQHIFNSENNSSNTAVFYVDGTSVLSGSGGAVTGTSKAVIGTAFGTNGDPLAGRLQEVLIYNQYDSNYRTGIESNIMTYYNIP